MILQNFSSLLLFLALPVLTSPYKILVVPFLYGYNSRLLNLQKLADVFAQDGHDVTVLMNTRISEHTITKYAKTIEFFIPEEITDLTDLEMKKTTPWNFLEMVEVFLELEYNFDKALMRDKAFLKQIHEAKFDLIFGDLNCLVTNLMASHLDITTILYQNFLSPSESNIFFPITLSITCTLPGMLCHSHNMNFKERVVNFISYIYFDHFSTDNIIKTLHQFAEELDFTLHVPLRDVFKNKVTVINTNYVLDMPFPTMPHIFPISGLYHKDPSPLNKEFSDIIRSSQPHGVILLSFGTLMPDFDAEKADIFARVLGRLPQSVIWRFTGQPPQSLKSNTHLVKWFPQNDLLANPTVKLFITHCGISSTFESAFHGVPVVAVPLFADQEDNADKLVKRAKIGKKIDFYSLTEEQLEQAIREVLDDPKYKETAKKTSYLLNNNLVSPREQLRHLVNFTIESGGAPHLFHPYAVDMNWFQFHSLDVILFISIVLLIVGSIFFFTLRWLMRYFWKTVVSPKKQKTL